MASKEHVFLSWHDIQFSVPVIKDGGGQGVNNRNVKSLIDIDDPRVTLLTSHNNSSRNTGGSVFDGLSSTGRNSEGKFNPVNASNF